MPLETTKPRFIEYKKDDMYIPVMGVTGSGKSSFVTQCCPWVSGIVSDGLNSFTSDCTLYSLEYNGRSVHLIDTPGFNDTNRSDTEVLRQVATWLAEAYRVETKISGIVYFHGIHESRMKGSDMTNLRVFKKISGLNNMKSVILATSFWDQTDQTIGEEREALLKEKFWREMIQNGAQTMRFMNETESARMMLEHLIHKNAKTTLQIQHEMSEQGISLRDTAAGQELDREIRAQIQKVEAQMKEEMEAMQQALREQNEREIEESARAQQRLTDQIKDLQERQNKLNADTAQLLREKEEQIRTYQSDIRQITTTMKQMESQHESTLRSLQQETSFQKSQLDQMQMKYDRIKADMQREASSQSTQLVRSVHHVPVYREASRPRGGSGSFVDGAVLGGAGVGAAAAGIGVAALACNVM